MELNQSTFKLKVEDLIYEFSADGFIQQIYLIDFDGVELPMIKNDFGRIHIKMSDGRVLKPFVRENTMPERGKFQEAEVVEFGEILWKDESENEIKGFRLALRYELWPGGRAFTTAFFCSNCIHSPDMDEFALKFDLAMSEFKDVRWSIRPRPKSFDGAVIQELNFARYLPRHEFEH